MAIARLVRKVKRPYGLWVKMTAVTILGLCFIFVWGVFSNSSSSITTQRESFEDIAEPVSSSSSKGVQTEPPHKKKNTKPEKRHNFGGVSNKEKNAFEKNEKKADGSATHQEHNKGVAPHEKKRVHKDDKEKTNQGSKGSDQSEDKEEKDEGEQELEAKEEGLDRDGEEGVDVDMVGGGNDLAESLDQDSELLEDGGEDVEEQKTSKLKMKGPLFDPNASYKWKVCSARSKHNYIPCIDIEVGGGKVQSHRHTERSCPRVPVMCLVPLPHRGYGYPLPWPESKLKVLEKVR